MLAVLPPLDRLGGLSIDTLFWLRATVFGRLHAPETSPTVVVALDEETHRRAPFEAMPSPFWTRDIAPVLDAMIAGGAKVVGFDIIFSKAVDQVDEKLRGFERPFLMSLRRGADQGKLLLGKVQHGERPIAPHFNQSSAVRHETNTRANNLIGDRDEMIRRVPLYFEAETRDGMRRKDTSMSLELAARALGQKPERQADGTVRLGDWTIPGSAQETILANFDAGSDIPTFSLADLYACTEKGDPAFFKKHFEGKVVLIGAVLDLEDRKLTSKRFINAPDSSAFARCVHEPMRLARQDFAFDTLPGVYIHATAVNNLVRRDPLVTVRPWAGFLAGLVLCAEAALLAMLLPPLAGAFGVAGAMLLHGGLAVWFFRSGTVIPLLPPVVGAALVFAVILAFRFAVADKDKRFLRKSFAIYLPPSKVDEMLAQGKLPALGGEQRVVTVLFSDVAGFTSISEKLTPAELVALMNEYLSAMTEIVNKYDGIVDKFIGDAIVAVFGAPLDDKEHALHAVQCALECRTRLEELNRSSAILAGKALTARIGVNTGLALAGNIGSKERMNYTVMGDTVNLASRLEGANKVYRTSILVSEDTVAAVGERIRWREIDSVRVKGRRREVRIFQPLLPGEEPPPEFAAALAAYRDGSFEEATVRFRKLALSDPTARMFAERSERLAKNPPKDWEGVTALDTK